MMTMVVMMMMVMMKVGVGMLVMMAALSSLPPTTGPYWGLLLLLLLPSPDSPGPLLTASSSLVSPLWLQLVLSATRLPVAQHGLSTHTVFFL